jgi:hypothetical protein
LNLLCIFAEICLLTPGNAVHQIIKDFKKTSDSVRRAVLYNTRSAFEIPIYLVTPNERRVNLTYIEVCIGKYLPDISYL